MIIDNLTEIIHFTIILIKSNIQLGTWQFC